jgi:hypothetical protein
MRCFSFFFENHYFFLDVFTLKSHRPQYNCKSLSIDYNACGVSAKMTKSSAKSNKYNLTSMPSMLLFIFKRMSFTKNKNIRLEMGSPCLTPMYDVKKVEFSEYL